MKLRKDTNYKLLLICGVSGSGKTFIEDDLIKNCSDNELSFNKMIQCTTREPRSEEEVNLRVYDFISEEEYDKIKDDLIAKTNVNGKRYGTYNKFKKLIKRRKNRIINTCIVNRIGYDNIINDLKDRQDIDIITIEITANYDTMLREGRNIDKEKEELEGIADYKLDNSSINRITGKDVIKLLKEVKFV